METFDSQGRLLPIGAVGQGIVSKKITDKDEREQGTRHRQQKKAEPLQPPEKDDDYHTESHVIDIVV